MATPVEAYSRPADLTPAGGPPAIPVYFAAAAGGHTIYSGRAVVTGWTAHNTDAAAAHVATLFDGGGAGGQQVDIMRLASSIAQADLLGASGVLCRNGVFVNDSSGLIEGIVWIIPL